METNATHTEPTMTAIPTNGFDANAGNGMGRIFSVYAPHFRTNKLIARNVTYMRARQIAEHHGAFVYMTEDIPS